VSIDDAELVFVGYGIQAPEYQWDDFKGVNLKGKVLVMLNNDPDWDPKLFAGKRRLYYGRWVYKYESAARQGRDGSSRRLTGCPGGIRVMSSRPRGRRHWRRLSLRNSWRQGLVRRREGHGSRAGSR
jgi:hypothetical protein